MARGTKLKTYLRRQLLDTDFAAEYLAQAIAEGDRKFLADAMAKVIQAHGATRVADETGIARQAIYRMLSIDGNPSFKNVHKLLDAIGLELTIKPKKTA
ncbi:MAG: putative addiction module antidote protein [Bdellovibrionales bacterium]|nr:putative addiction module antidote protein [Bdellovibrionales bacterium]